MSGTPEEAIRAAFLGSVAVAQRGDADGYMKHLTEDAIIMGSGLSPLEGASAIHPWVEGFFAGFTLKFSEWDSREVLVFGHAALHRYSGVATMVSKADGHTVGQERQYLDVMRRGADDEWRISHHVFYLVE